MNHLHSPHPALSQIKLQLQFGILDQACTLPFKPGNQTTPCPAGRSHKVEAYLLYRPNHWACQGARLSHATACTDTLQDHSSTRLYCHPFLCTASSVSCMQMETKVAPGSSVDLKSQACILPFVTAAQPTMRSHLVYRLPCCIWLNNK